MRYGWLVHNAGAGPSELLLVLNRTAMKRVFMLLPLLGGVALHAANLPPDFVDETVGGGWTEAVGLTFAPDRRMFV